MRRRRDPEALSRHRAGQEGLDREESFRRLLGRLREYAIVSLDERGRIRTWNKGAERLSGYRAREVLGRGFAFCFTRRDRAEGLPRKLLERARRGRELRYAGWKVRRDESRIWVEAVMTALRGPGRAVVGFTVVGRDLTVSKLAEERLRAGESLFRLLADSSFEGIVIHEQGRILRANRTMADMLGCRQADLLGKDWYSFVAPESRAFVRKKRLAGATGLIRADLVKADGRRIPAEGRARLGTLLGNPVYVVTARDLSERFQVEEIRAFARRIQEAQESERRRIALELHDSVAQLLSTASSAAKTACESSPDAACLPAAQRAVEALTQALEEVRRIMRNLRPPLLDDLGFAAAIRDLAGEFQARTGIRVRCRIPRRLEDLPAETELALYRIAQEALTNVEKHARASRVSIELSVGRTRVHLRVRDDGRGFSVPQGERHGLGLTGIRERAALLGGEARIVSGPREGTEISVRVPARREGKR
jgi:PAS domain S-box-containing protein